ncbi:hypothetical protein [Micromonospora purpureochromogenes]|uniref:hypothetical protein n=1 Tax=Micromonospora purpureochromogenes TaxID=47872 RepID=UPI000B5AFCC6|nr:hypothetical protein [Micromonospora purpureochromogenes]
MSGAVQAGWAPPSGPGEPAPTRGWPRWLLAVTVLWAVLLGALTWWSVRHDPPTVREQRTLAEAGPVADRAVGRLVAATGDGAWQLAAPRLDRGCRVTPMDDGASLARDLDVVVAEGGERALLEAVAGRLPADWRAGVHLGSDGPRLRADAGDFVAVHGRVVTPGRVRLTVDTGCRPDDVAYATLLPGYAGEPALDEALRALGRPAGTREQVVAPCPGGGVARTAWVAAGAAPASLAGLKPLAAGRAVVDTPEVYAYRRGTALVLADATGEQVRVSASTGC